MKKYNIKHIDTSYLKRKKNEILVFDIYVNQINEIKILYENKKSNFYFYKKIIFYNYYHLILEKSLKVGIIIYKFIKILEIIQLIKYLKKRRKKQKQI